MVGESQNWFDQGGDAYARYRPDYPDTLAEFLADAAPDTSLALDVGCGNGQFTRQLGNFFSAVIGSDPSADQISHAAPHPHVSYEVGPAEKLSASDGSASSITAAQAAHWFDLPRFYSEARRVAMPHASIALVSYGVVQLEPDLRSRFRSFYRDQVGPFWPPERILVDTGYAGIDFPFREQTAPELYIVRQWSASDFLGYISTWSAVRRARQAGEHQMLEAYSIDLLDHWGEPTEKREFVWPINMRLGVID